MPSSSTVKRYSAKTYRRRNVSVPKCLGAKLLTLKNWRSVLKIAVFHTTTIFFVKYYLFWRQQFLFNIISITKYPAEQFVFSILYIQLVHSVSQTSFSPTFHISEPHQKFTMHSFTLFFFYTLSMNLTFSFVTLYTLFTLNIFPISVIKKERSCTNCLRSLNKK